MKRKNQNKCYRARAVTLMIVFKNIYQIFPPITLVKCMFITNQYVQRHFFGELLYYAYSRYKNFGRYNAKAGIPENKDPGPRTLEYSGLLRTQDPTGPRILKDPGS